MTKTVFYIAFSRTNIFLPAKPANQIPTVPRQFGTRRVGSAELSQDEEVGSVFAVHDWSNHGIPSQPSILYIYRIYTDTYTNTVFYTFYTVYIRIYVYVCKMF